MKPVKKMRDGTTHTKPHIEMIAKAREALREQQRQKYKELLKGDIDG